MGVLGPRGDGTAAHFGIVDEVDLIVGTFSKSLASIGGFVAGTEPVIHFLRHHAPHHLYRRSTPANTAGVLAALRVMQREPTGGSISGRTPAGCKRGSGPSASTSA